MKTLTAIALVAAIGCGKKGTSAVIGSGGGLVGIPGGPALQVPAGALASDVTISIEESGTAAPPGALSKVYRFSPEGTTFTVPASVAFPVPANTAGASIYWTRLSSTDYDPLTATIAGGNATAQTSHLGDAVLAAGRAVSGAFTTVHEPDSGSSTTQPAVPPSGETISAAVALASQSTGYLVFPGTLNSDGTFVIPGVPAGHYFLTVTPPSPPTTVYELSAGSPDLSVVDPSRFDVAAANGSARVSYTVTGLTAWTAGDSMQAVSSQASVETTPFFPPNAATTFNGTASWTANSRLTPVGLPSAAKGDAVFFMQSINGTTGSGANAATTTTMANCVQLTNLTLANGATTNATVALAAAPQNGSAPANVKLSQFDALAASVNPSAKSLNFDLLVQARPHALSFPDKPVGARATLLKLFLNPLPSPVTDANYGAQPYGQCLVPLWKEYRSYGYLFSVAVSGTTVTAFGGVSGVEPMSPAPADPIVPVLGPVKAPQIGGKDAFSIQSGVGTSPTFSWTAPAVGTATSYTVRVFNGSSQAEVFEGTVRGTSLQVTPGVLAAGTTYYASITANQATFDTLDAPPLRSGMPIYAADAITAAFSP